MLLHEVVDLAPLHKRRTGISSSEVRKAASRPGFGESNGKVLRICSHIQGSGGVSPDLPSRGGRSEFLKEPGLLHRPQDCLRWLALPEIRDVGLPIWNKLRRLLVAISPAPVKDFQSL